MARPKQYNGTLNPKQIADGMNAAGRNAARLLDDAQLLLNNRRFSTAFSVAILSIEESGKCGILRELAAASTAAEAKACWGNYRSHTAKNRHWLAAAWIADGARLPRDFDKLFDQSSDHAYLLEKVKQVGLYTDCFGDAVWSEPVNAIDERSAREVVRTATDLAGRTDVTDTEIESWVKHIGRLSGDNLVAMLAGFERWYEDMQRLGVPLPPGAGHAITESIYRNRRAKPEEEESNGANQRYVQDFYRKTGMQYYIAGRFACLTHQAHVAGNLFHHAVEMFLKAHLSEFHSLKDLASPKLFGHDLGKLWKRYKELVTVDQLDDAIARLHKWEEIRYPREGKLKGMVLVSGPTRDSVDQTRIVDKADEIPVPRYEVDLETADKVMAAISQSSGWNPRFFGPTLQAREWLHKDNSALPR